MLIITEPQKDHLCWCLHSPAVGWFSVKIQVQQDVLVKHKCPCNGHFLKKTVTLIFDLDLDFGTKQRVLPQGIYM